MKLKSFEAFVEAMKSKINSFRDNIMIEEARELLISEFYGWSKAAVQENESEELVNIASVAYFVWSMLEKKS